MGFGDVKTPTFVSVEKDTSHFSVKRQDQEAFAVQSISGFLVGADYINSTYNGKPTPKLSLKFVDHTSNEDFIFQTSFTGGYSQTILNCLAGVERSQFGVVGLKLIEKDGKPRMQVFHNEMYCQWKYKPEEMPQPEELKNKIGQVLGIDYTERTNWLRETVLQEVQAKLPSLYARKELVEGAISKARLLTEPPEDESIKWHREPAALPERSAAADYVPFPTSNGTINVPRSILDEAVPFPTDDDIPF